MGVSTARDRLQGRPFRFTIDLTAQPASNPAEISAARLGSGDELSNLVRRAVGFLERRFLQSVTLRDIEDATTGKPHQLIRAFRRDLGTTPHAFIIQLRVRHAMSLLEDGQRIVDAAADAGFVDQSHLTKHFKRIYGTTPGKFLRRRRLQRTMTPDTRILNLA
jgi:methylphosphotriester-DNA--protein-cysteine methyltransferase